MTNVHYDSVEKFRDVEVFNTYGRQAAKRPPARAGTRPC